MGKSIRRNNDDSEKPDHRSMARDYRNMVSNGMIAPENFRFKRDRRSKNAKRQREDYQFDD
jgi:hypothetical protein